MRILVVTQYFWPENFKINDVVNSLVELGHEVEVFTGKPNYPGGKFYEGYGWNNKNTETFNGNIKVNRVNLLPRGKSGGVRLFLNYFSFAFMGCLKAMSYKGDFDVIFVYEPSPVTVGLPAVVLKRKLNIPIVFWVQDLWPQSIIDAGGINNSTVIGLMGSLTKWIYSRCNLILIQSEAFKEVLVKQGVSLSKIKFHPNSVENFFKPKVKNTDFEKYFPKGFNIVFAGNIGKSQGFETIIKAAKEVSKYDSNINWIIVGDGRKRKESEEKVKKLSLDKNVLFLGSYPLQSMPDFYAHADALLVSLKTSPIFKLTIPSKMQSYLACGKPVLACLEGEGARIVTESNSGLSCLPDDFIELSKTVLKLSKMTKTELESMGENGRDFYLKNYERNMLSKSWLTCLKA